MSIFHQSGHHTPEERARREEKKALKRKEIQDAFFADEEEEKRPPRPKKRFSGALIALTVLVMLVLLAGICIAAFHVFASAPEVENTELIHVSETNVVGDRLEPVATPEPAPSPEPTPGTEEPETTPVPTTGRRDGVYTVLVVGKDIAGMNTDTIMVGCFDTVNQKLNVVSIPRDTLMNVPWSIKKINSCYGQANSEEGLCEYIQDLIGYKVDSYVVVEIKAFEQVIDAIGGVYFDVPVNMNWGDPVRGISYSIRKGEQWLNGRNALGVVRFRKNTDGSGYAQGDIGRIQTQQKFAMALAKQFLSAKNIPNLSKVINIITDNLKTNLTSANVAYYAQEFLKLDSDDITFETMPFDSVYIKGGSYVSLQLQPWLEMLNRDLNPYYETITEDHLDILTYQNGNFYATTGVLAGGFASFYDYTTP